MTYTKITFSLFSYIGASYPLAQNEFLRLITADCIDVIKSRLQPGETPEPGDVTKSVMEAISLYVANFNAGAKATGTPRMKTISAPTASQLADFIKAFNHPRAIKFTDKEIDGDTEVGLYQQDGDKEGLYDTTPTTLNRLVRAYDYTADSKKIEEVRRNLVDILPRVQQSRTLFRSTMGFLTLKRKRFCRFRRIMFLRQRAGLTTIRTRITLLFTMTRTGQTGTLKAGWKNFLKTRQNLKPFGRL